MTKRNTFILGVTGVIGSGKSTLCQFLRDKYGFHWISGDEVVHELYQNGKAGYQKIKEYFGSQFVGKKEVNRGRLRQFVLKSPQKMRILNQLIHPLVVHEVNKKIVRIRKDTGRKQGKRKSPPRRDPAVAGQDKSKLVLICIEAVYFEPQDLGEFIDKLVLVDAKDEAILMRLKSRDIPFKQLKTFLKFQRKSVFQRFPNSFLRSKTISL